MNPEADPLMLASAPYWGYPSDAGFVSDDHSEPDIFSDVGPHDIDPGVEEAIDWQTEYLRVSRLPLSAEPPPTIMVPESQPPLSIDCTTPPRQVITDVPEPSKPTPPHRREVIYSTSPVDRKTAKMLGVRYYRKPSRYRPPSMYRSNSPSIDYRKVLDAYNNRCKPVELLESMETRNDAMRYVVVHTAERMMRPSNSDPLAVFDMAIRAMVLDPQELLKIVDKIDVKHRDIRSSLTRVYKRWVLETRLYEHELTLLQSS